MTIEILAFGITKDIIGDRKSLMNVREGLTIMELKDKLNSEYPELKKLKSLALACNETYALEQDVIPPNAIVALIPPVSGG